MSKYQARITEQNGEFYALVVRMCPYDGEVVLIGYKGRFFASRFAAEKSTAKYIAKISG